MSKQAQIVLWVVVAILVVGGFVWWAGSQAPSGSPAAETSNGTQTTPTANQKSAANSLVSNGTSDTALNGDLANIDGQMNSFNSDSASIDQGLNDQPVQQSQL